LGARRIPDPTTAGDFCRRFTPEDVHTLLDLCKDIRVNAWAGQPDAFFAQARIDLDGTLVDTAGECKQGMDIAYNGTWSSDGKHLVTAGDDGSVRIWRADEPRKLKTLEGHGIGGGSHCQMVVGNYARHHAATLGERGTERCVELGRTHDWTVPSRRRRRRPLSLRRLPLPAHAAARRGR
jgi:hypothetical protein